MMPYSMLRKSNVEATLDVIRLAVTKRVKSIVYISTLSVFGLTLGLRTETSELDTEGIAFMNGYGYFSF